MTENHDLQTPEKGTEDWHTPLNANFEKLDTDVEVRGTEAQLGSYSPKVGAKFFATDTGNVFIGDGDQWSPVPVGVHGHSELAIANSLQVPVKQADPTAPSVGEVWFREDTGELSVQTADGPQRLTSATSGDETDSSTEPTYDVTESFDDESWTQTFGDGWDYGLDSNASIQNVDGREGNQLQVRVPGGENRGIYTIHNHENRTGEAPTRCYHRFYLRFKPGFTDHITDDGKLPGFAGRDGTSEGAGGDPANGTGWSARMGWDDPEDYSGSGIPLDYYIYHMDAGGSYGEHDTWNILLDDGVWYEIEQYIDLGTPDSNDGVLRGWVDGQLKYERTDLRWRESGGNDVQWSWWDFYHGGGEAPTDDIYAEFDDLGIVRGGMP